MTDQGKVFVASLFVSETPISQDIDMGGVYRKVLNQSLRELVSISGLGAKWSTITRCHFMATY